MNKINWQNAPSTATPINAENLNQMQDNIEEVIEKLKPDELYYISTAADVTVILNRDITSYDIVTIILQSTDGCQSSVTLYKPTVGDKIGVFAPKINIGTVIYNKQAILNVYSSRNLRIVENYQLEGNTTIQTGNYIKIKAVLGYKV